MSTQLRKKQYLLLTLTTILAGFVGGFFAYTIFNVKSVTAKSSQDVFTNIFAQRLTLIDKNGNNRLLLFGDHEGTAGIIINDNKEKARLALSTDSNGHSQISFFKDESSSISFYNEGGIPIIELDANSKRGGKLWIYYPKDNLDDLPKLGIQLGYKDNTPILRFFDKDLKVTMGLAGGDSTSTLYFVENKKIIWLYPN